MRFWVYDGDYLLRRFARLEEARHFCKHTDFLIVKKPREKKVIDLSNFEEALV
jgi:hypothetical protein